jgi:glycosyltransferase involved in cell wall biosynthesis
VEVVTHWDTTRSDWLLGTTLRAPTDVRAYSVDGIQVHRLALSRAKKIGLVPAVALYYPLMELALGPISAVIEEQLEQFVKGANLIHNVRVGREGISLASLRVAVAHDIPFVFTPVHHPRWAGWRYRVFSEIYRAADMLIALTAAEKRMLEALGVQERRIRVTGVGPILASRASPADFRDTHWIEGPLVLFVGQHYPYKGFRQVLRAAPLVWKRHAEAKFVFIGPRVGRSEEVFRDSSDPRILRLGEVDLQTKTNALAACTVLCMPSTQESFGGVYTEAWSFGKPVMGCNIPAVSEVITDGRDGVLVAQEPRAIADAICQLLASPPSATAMGEAGRKKVQERYSWERLAALTEQAYFEVLGTQPAPPPSARQP